MMKEHKSRMYILPMGAGKTVMALTAITDLLKAGKVKKVLIVAPLKVSEATWPDEFDEWEHLKGWPYTLIRCEPNDIVIPPDVSANIRAIKKGLYGKGEKANKFSAEMKDRYRTVAAQKKRIELSKEDTPIHIINIEAVSWLWSLYPAGRETFYRRGGVGWPYDMLVLDESTVAKNGRIRVPVGINPKTGRKITRLSRFGALVAMSDLCKRHIVMTGTPIPRTIENIWGQIRITDGGKRLGDTMTDFRKMYFNRDYMGWKFELRPNAREEITDKISDICYSLDQTDLVKLPPVITYDFKVNLPPKVMKEYKVLKETLVSEYYGIEAANRGVLHSKLLQFANGSVYKSTESLDPENNEPIAKDVFVHDEKLKALKEIVEEIGDEPVLVAYTFRFDLNRIKRAFKHAVVFNEGDARKIKADWNDGKIKMLLGHPASIGHGQNLQYGGRNIVWYGLTPDLELYQQFNKRLHRRGQTKKVYMYRIIAKGTLDEKLLPILDERAENQQALIDDLRL